VACLIAVDVLWSWFCRCFSEKTEDLVWNFGFGGLLAPFVAICWRFDMGFWHPQVPEPTVAV
jgi:hypothetical protein